MSKIEESNTIANERAISILADYLNWLNRNDVFLPSYAEISAAIDVCIKIINTHNDSWGKEELILILIDMRNHINFENQVFFHALQEVENALNIAIEFLKKYYHNDN